MGLVEGVAVFAMSVEEHVLGRQSRKMAGGEFGQVAVIAHMLVGIGHVARRRNQEQRIAAGGAAFGPDEERDALHLLAVGKPGGVDAALQVLRNLENEIGLPAGVIEIVVVEMDRTIMLRCA